MDKPNRDGFAPTAPEVAVEDLYENAPSGCVCLWPDGRIARTNATLSQWLGYQPNTLQGRLFTDLLTGGGRIHFETHFVPLLHTTGRISGITIDLLTADANRLPMFLTANVKTDAAGLPTLVRINVQDARDRRSYERELLDARARSEYERARVQELASTLRRSLVPPSLSPPHGVEAAVYYHTSSTDDVGGDFYDLFPLSRDKWGFFLGDVCGKGAGAAALTSLTRYTLRAAAVYDEDPVAVLHNLDTVLNHESHGDDPRYCTVIFGLLTKHNNGFEVILASGGHPPALLLRAGGRAEYVNTTGGQAVGLFPSARFVATRILLAPGDTLVLYTDGLTEAKTGVGAERFDDHGELLDFGAAHTPTTAASIIESIRSMLDDFGPGLQDDVAVLALGVATDR